MTAKFVQNVRQAQFDTGETVQGAFCEGESTTYATGSVSASTDPFSGKTNKYAESKIVRIIASAAAHVKFSAAGTAATTSHWYIAANTEYYFVVGDGKEYLRVIPTTGSASFWASEVF